jgi:hypothetical protein
MTSGYGPWSLLLQDLLIARMMELAVHSDLTVSVGIATPMLGQSAGDTAVDLAFSRAEGASAATAAF